MRIVTEQDLSGRFVHGRDAADDAILVASNVLPQEPECPLQHRDGLATSRGSVGRWARPVELDRRGDLSKSARLDNRLWDSSYHVVFSNQNWSSTSVDE